MGVYTGECSFPLRRLLIYIAVPLHQFFGSCPQLIVRTLAPVPGQVNLEKRGGTQGVFYSRGSSSSNTARMA